MPKQPIAARFAPLFLLILPLCGAAPSAHAEDAAPDSSRGWSLFPAVYYTNETRLAVGAYGVYHFRNPGSPHTSTLSTNLIYTMRNQVLAGLVSDVHWKHYRSLGVLFGLKYPNIFYGIGRDTKSEHSEDYTDRSVTMLLTFQRRLLGHAHLGPVAVFEAHNLTDLDPDGALEQGTLPGTHVPYRISGAGAMATWDTRSHNVYPTSGGFHRASVIWHGSAIGSDFGLASYELDLRQYVSISGQHTLALQLLARAVTGGAPIFSYPILGENNLRGFASRYRDRSLLVLHGEYRVRFRNRFGFGLFAGLGDVANELGDLSLSEPKLGAGIGLRYLLVPAAQLYLRVDFALGSGGNSSFVFVPREAF